MNEILAIGLRGMQGDMASLNQIGVNLVNELTPGYKRGVTVQAAQGASFAAHLNSAATPPESAVGPVAPLLDIATDARTGTFKSTGQSLDVALAGTGFFEVATDAGPVYTRQGNFRLDARGRLVTAQGDPVMGISGEIVLNGASPVIAASGAITTGDGTPVAQLKVVEFEGRAGLRPLGDGMHAAGQGMKLVGEADAQVRQGFLENSNVNPSHEMTSLIQAMRHFESMQKVVQGYDDMVGSAIRKLGDTS